MIPICAFEAANPCVIFIGIDMWSSDRFFEGGSLQCLLFGLSEGCWKGVVSLARELGTGGLSGFIV